MFLTVRHGFWDLSSPTRDRTRAVKALSPNHCTARKFPRVMFFVGREGWEVRGRVTNHPGLSGTGRAPGYRTLGSKTGMRRSPWWRGRSQQEKPWASVSRSWLAPNSLFAKLGNLPGVDL